MSSETLSFMPVLKPNQIYACNTTTLTLYVLTLFADFAQNPPLFRVNVKKGLKEKNCIYIYICIKKGLDHVIRDRAVSFFLAYVGLDVSFQGWKSMDIRYSRCIEDLLIGVVGQIQHQQAFFLREARDIAMFITSNKATECWALDM